tara:strand:+ start:6212 stop:6574 length:363 start_codon:yes stop_codon:yes gene_type:complete
MGKQKAKNRPRKSIITNKGIKKTTPTTHRDTLNNLMSKRPYNTHNENMKELVRMKQQQSAALYNKKKRVGISTSRIPKQKKFSTRISHALMATAVATKEGGIRHRVANPIPLQTVHNWII